MLTKIINTKIVNRINIIFLGFPFTENSNLGHNFKGEKTILIKNKCYFLNTLILTILNSGPNLAQKSANFLSAKFFTISKFVFNLIILA